MIYTCKLHAKVQPAASWPLLMEFANANSPLPRAPPTPHLSRSAAVYFQPARRVARAIGGAARPGKLPVTVTPSRPSRWRETFRRRRLGCRKRRSRLLPPPPPLPVPVPPERGHFTTDRRPAPSAPEACRARPGADQTIGRARHRSGARGELLLRIVSLACLSHGGCEANGPL